MKRYSILYLLVGLLFTACTHKEKNKVKHKEKYYQAQLCDKLDGVMEKTLADRTRVDCLTSNYAIEVDFSKKWAESIGQSLYYAEMTGKKPAIGLIVGDTATEERHLRRVEIMAEKYDIKIFEIKREE